MTVDFDSILQEYVDIDPETTYILSKDIKNKYKNYDFPIEILVEIDVNTRLRDEYIKKNNKFVRDAIELENFRKFEPYFLRNRGIFYCEGIHFAAEYDFLNYTTFRHITNGAFNGRYCLPLCLPNGDVFTWMTYDPNARYKYMLPKVIGRESLNYFHQGNILGNLESLTLYKGPILYICEGLFDAYRINEQFNAPAVALLGSAIGKNKEKLLKMLKEDTKKQFIFVPDFDPTGLKENIINYWLWDDIFNYQKVYNTTAKDIDKYFRDLQIEKEEKDIQ